MANIVGLIILSVAVFFTDKSAGDVGFNLLYLLGFAMYASFIILLMMEVEIRMISAERTLNYTELNSELASEQDLDTVLKENGWP